jgi:hypothetical protein
VRVLQGWQAVPWVPHWEAEGCSQTFPLQQPLGQLVASQMQAPLMQCWPAPQALAPLPHTQAIPEQRSVDSVVQETQTSPWTPQWAVTDCWQTPFRQQPLPQLDALQPEQVPPWQS